jgi:competence protein ComGC
VKPRLSHQRNRALTKIEVVVIVAALAVLVALLLPALAASKRKSSLIGCISNVKQIGIAFRLWEGDNNDKYPMAVSVTNGGVMELIAPGKAYVLWQTVSNQLNSPKILHCPADADHITATNFTTGFSDANISYFVTPDAVETYPQMILAGDDNLLMNGKPVHPGILTLWTNQTVAWTKDRHCRVGNISMADGSAQQVTSNGLNSALARSAATNRWLIP